MREIKCPKCGEVFQADEAGYAAIVKQVRDEEFSRELAAKESQFQSDKESALRLTRLETENRFKDDLNRKDGEIEKLKSEIEAARLAGKATVSELTAEKDRRIADLQGKLDALSKDKEIEIHTLLKEKERELAEKESRILLLSGEQELFKKEVLLKEQSLKEQYENELKNKDEEIERLKNYKLKQSTKMVGESLEHHCETEFNRLRATGFQSAYFEKDNDAKLGSKGDYIYRDYDQNGTEFVSIMFEMKNEVETTASKKKNTDFLKELDKDRRQKNCEYAFLVSMLQP